MWKRLLTKIDNFSKDIKMYFPFAKKKYFMRYRVICDPASNSPLQKSFRQLLLNQRHHRNIHCNTAIFIFMFIDQLTQLPTEVATGVVL